MVTGESDTFVQADSHTTLSHSRDPRVTLYTDISMPIELETGPSTYGCSLPPLPPHLSHLSLPPLLRPNSSTSTLNPFLVHRPVGLPSLSWDLHVAAHAILFPVPGPAAMSMARQTTHSQQRGPHAARCELALSEASRAGGGQSRHTTQQVCAAGMCSACSWRTCMRMYGRTSLRTCPPSMPPLSRRASPGPSSSDPSAAMDGGAIQVSCQGAR